MEPSPQSSVRGGVNSAATIYEAGGGRRGGVTRFRSATSMRLKYFLFDVRTTICCFSSSMVTEYLREATMRGLDPRQVFEGSFDNAPGVLRAFHQCAMYF